MSRIYELAAFLAFPKNRTTPIDFWFRKPEHAVMSMTLRAYRKERGLSLEQLGAQIGKSKATLSDIENGGRCTPKLALEIEAHTGGVVNAATLSEEIAQARQAA